MENKWDIRFEQVELIALMVYLQLLLLIMFKELNWIIHSVDVKGLLAQIRPTVDPRLLEPLDSDLRCILTWDTDMSGTFRCKYFSRQRCGTRSGGTKWRKVLQL